MKEVKGNLWNYPADARVITTNGTIKKNGECVMGRGCALEATKCCSSWNLKAHLGKLISEKGNHVHFLYDEGQQDMVSVYSFPVKHNWYEKADLALIERSAKELLAIADESYPKDQGYLVSDTTSVIVLPRPGCGNGGLKWEDVKPVLEPILDDRFHVITFE
jgi:hypothetical protein